MVPIQFFVYLLSLVNFVKMYMLTMYRQTITNDSYRNYVFTRGQYVVRKVLSSVIRCSGGLIYKKIVKIILSSKFILSCEVKIS